jgi:glycosyltransferase involved in cell wall biosynthesis
MISVIIGTHNRRDKLQMLLKSLASLEIDEGRICEMIIVDNNSTDDTKEVVKNYSENSRRDIRYIFEGKQGNNYARNTAIVEAKGEVLAFTDDDCVLDSTWIRQIWKKFESEPALACLGGRVELYDKNDRAITIRTFGEETEVKSASQLYRLIIGCNMAIRRTVFDDIGTFDPAFGPGSKIGSGGDSEFLYRAYKRGLIIKYYPDIIVYHNHGRKTDAEVKALGKRYVRGRGGFYCKYILQGDRIIMKMALDEMTSVMKSLIKNLLLGKSIKSQWRVTWGLIVGVIRGLPIFLRRAVASRSRPTPGSTWRSSYHAK